MNDDLATVMTHLTEPAPPASLKATVMARIAREADREAPGAATAQSAARRRDWLVWLATFAGLAVVIAAVAAPWIVEGTLPDLGSPRFGPVSIAPIPERPLQLIVGAGLLVLACSRRCAATPRADSRRMVRFAFWCRLRSRHSSVSRP